MWSIILKLFTLKKLTELWEVFTTLFPFFFDTSFRAAVRVAKFVLVEVDELSDLTNEAKRLEAWGRIKAVLGEEGRFVKDSTINKAIEIVLDWLKAQGVLTRKAE